MKITEAIHAFPPKFDSIAGRHNGMTLRAWIAGQVAAGVVSGSRGVEIDDISEHIAMVSVKVADAVIAELDKDSTSYD